MADRQQLIEWFGVEGAAAYEKQMEAEGWKRCDACGDLMWFVETHQHLCDKFQQRLKTQRKLREIR